MTHAWQARPATPAWLLPILTFGDACDRRTRRPRPFGRVLFVHTWTRADLYRRGL